MIFIPIYELGEMLLFAFWHKPLVLAYMSVFAERFTLIEEDLFSLYELTKTDLNRNGQVISLEDTLNSMFSNVTGGIFIEDGVAVDQLYIFNASEGNEPLYIYNASEMQPPLYIYNASEIESYADFIVNVPAALSLDLDAVSRVVETYKLAGTTFQIEQY